MHEESKHQSVTEWCGCDKCGVIDTNVECYCCHKVEAVEYFKLYGMRQKCSYSKGLNSSLACEIVYLQ